MRQDGHLSTTAQVIAPNINMLTEKKLILAY